MKKYISTLVFISLTTVCFAVDLTRYKEVAPIKEIKINQPAIVEIGNLEKDVSYIVVDDKGEAVEQQFEVKRTVKVIPPESVLGCAVTCVTATALLDTKQDTTFDFPLRGEGVQKGSIKIVYAKPLETDFIQFETTGDSYTPTSFVLTIDGKRILNTISGNRARFPKMVGKNIEIEFEYTQPIRFTEVGVGITTEEEVLRMIRFVYKPTVLYNLYSNSLTGRETTPIPSINLFAKKKEFDLVLGQGMINPLYKEKKIEEKDSDGDTVLDGKDNCPLHANSDQKDGNGNGIGDVCDDYDYDGVITYQDNCPEIANQDQKDIDRDGLGDMCDTEESRVTEKYPWMPWAVFIGVFSLVSFMVYEAIKIKKERQI